MSTAPAPQGRPSVFRKEALAHYQRVVQEEGDLLRISSAWPRAALGVVALFTAVLVSCALVRVEASASFPARVQVVEAPPGQAPGAAVHALVPSRYRARLRPGQPVRVALAGLPAPGLELPLTSVGAEALPGDAATRWPSPSTEAPGPRVAVRVDVPSHLLAPSASPGALTDGMAAQLDLPLGPQPLLGLLLASLKGPSAHDD